MDVGSFFGLSAYHILMVAIGAAIFASHWLPRLAFPRAASSAALLMIVGLVTYTVVPRMEVYPNFISGQAAIDRLAQQSRQQMPGVLAPPDLRESFTGQSAQPERFIELAIGKQSTVGRDLAAVEFQLQPPVETDPEKPLL